ncbi:MAG: hypothetical protein V4621_04600 [Pseudomonadota bacterium]
MKNFEAYLDSLDTVSGAFMQQQVQKHIDALDAENMAIAALMVAERCGDIIDFRFFIQKAYDTSEHAGSVVQSFIGYEMCRLCCCLTAARTLSPEEHESMTTFIEEALVMGAETIAAGMEELTPLQGFERIKELIKAAKSDQAFILMPVFQDMAFAVIEKCDVSHAQKARMCHAVKADMLQTASPRAANDPVFNVSPSP